MRIAVIGAGGVGGYFGGRLAEAGEEVWFAARGEHGRAMAERGLTLRSDLGDAHIRPVNLIEDPAEAGPMDVVLICVKMRESEAAVDLARPMIGPETMVISLQNGIDAEPMLASRLGETCVLGGTAHISAHIAEPGVIEQIGQRAGIVFGELDGRVSTRAQQFKEACERAGFEARLTEDARQAIWAKFVMLTAFAGAGAYHRMSAGELRENDEARALYDALVEEAVELAEAEGVALPEDMIADRRSVLAKFPASMKASMLVDLERGKPMELPWLNGAVERLAALHGLPAPATAQVVEALSAHANGETSRAEDGDGT